MKVSGVFLCFFFSSRRRHTRYWRDWSSDVCSSDLRGEMFVTVRGLNVLGHHMNLALYLLAPFYRIGAGPEFLAFAQIARSEERRVGKECRSRWSPYH